MGASAHLNARGTISFSQANEFARQASSGICPSRFGFWRSGIVQVHNGGVGVAWLGTPHPRPLSHKGRGE